MRHSIPLYMSAEEYTKVVQRSMLDYLNNAYGSGQDNHIVDLTSAAGSFMDSVFYFVENLPTRRQEDMLEKLEILVGGEKYANKGCDPLYDDALDSIMEKIRKVYEENA